MLRTDRPIAAWRVATVVAPLALALTGCMAVPVAELAASGSNGGGFAGTVHKMMPGNGPTLHDPCAARTANAAGCNADPAGDAMQDRAMEQPVANAPEGPCAESGSATGSAGCGAGGMDSVMRGLAGSLQNLMPNPARSQ